MTSAICARSLEENLIANLDRRVEFESENEAEIIDYIREVMDRRMGGDFGADSMYDFLTRARYTYPRNIAMRKLDAARVMQSFPYIKQWIYDGELHLSQISMFQTAVRQKPASLELQAEVLEKIRNHTLENTQFILCEKLGLEIKIRTKVRVQRDGSRRVEITFTEEQWAHISNAKDILSHSVPSGDLAEVLSYCAKYTAKAKDPAAPRSTTKSSQKLVETPNEPTLAKAEKNPNANLTHESGVLPRQ